MGESTQRRHPEHDRLVEEVRSWYRTTRPELGYRVERRRFGLYRRNVKDPDSALVIVKSVVTAEIPEFLADISRYFGNRAVSIWLDDKDLDTTLGSALVSAGASRDEASTYLAHVGQRPEPVQLSGITAMPVTAETLRDYVLVKLKGFANSDDEPPVEHVDKELAVRTSELASIGRFLIARVGEEPVAILGYYNGNDRLIFNLATRVPFRNRAIAKHLLCRVLVESYDGGCRSVIINTNPDDTPIRWYRRLGFTDPVYWLRRYLFDPATSRRDEIAAQPAYRTVQFR